MEFTSKTGGTGDYEKPKPGTYTGVCVGFADIGTQPGGQYGPKPKVMLRWELHRRKGPALDSQGRVMTVTERYTASADKKATFRAVAEAHIGPLPDGRKWQSGQLLGECVKLTLVESEDGKYVNVKTVVPLDPEEDAKVEPTLPLEHWEMRDEAAPPAWAKYAVEKSEEWQRKAGFKADNGKLPVGAVAGGADDDSDPF
jgi:hypothetical protein